MDLIHSSAREVIAALKAGEVSILEVLDAVEARISAVDGDVHALPTLCFERARERAKVLQAKPVEERGLLAGLPVPIKDLSEVEGVLTTHGSPIFKDNIPAASDYIVERIEASGGIVYAKSNTPEFGSGGNTFNEVFESTRNPWDLRMSAAGSSGGAAAALASGTAWLAQGSDMGGSLRNPASFCGIVGMRPSPGRVPNGPSTDPYNTLSASGPMARDIDDVALFLDALSGLEPREPISIDAPAIPFRDAAAARRKPVRVAFSADLGITPVDPEVAALCEQAARAFESMGIPVEEAHPDLSETHETFQILRAEGYALGMQDLLDQHRDLFKWENVWNIEKGLAQSVTDVRRAVAMRGQMVERATRFFETYDLLLTPATIVPPFPVEQRYVTHCAGQALDTYIDWLAIAFAITLVSLPALSLPCGFTKSGLPVGLQMVGRPRGEAGLLSAAGVLQDVLNIPTGPIDPRPTAQEQ